MASINTENRNGPAMVSPPSIIAAGIAKMFDRMAPATWGALLFPLSSTSWFLVLIAVLTVAQFFPLWLGLQVYQNSVFAISMKSSSSVQIAAGFTLGFLSIIFIDLTFDLFAKNYKFWVTRSLYFWIVFFQILLLLIYDDKYPILLEAYASYLQASTMFLVARATMDLRYFDRTKTWTNSINATLVSVLFVGILCGSISVYTGSKVIRNAGISFRCCFLGLFALQCVRAMHNILKTYKFNSYWSKLRSLSFDDTAVFLISSAVIITGLVLVVILPACTTKFQGLSTATPAYLIVDLIVRGVYATGLELIPSLLLKFKAVKLERDLDVKRIFVRFVSHEIRTPLNVAIAGLDILKKTNTFDDDTADLIGDIEDSCKIAVTMVDDLLAYEKISTGVLALDKQYVDAKCLIESTVAMFKLQARAKRITLSVLENEDAIQSSLYLHADKGKICQVLRNLISNALKFTPLDGVVRIESVELLNTVAIRIIDSGVGIAPENLPRVLNEIIQFDVNKNQQGGGSGMGLWISKQIVELHGGTVVVSSEGLGRGCCFEVCLNIARNPSRLSYSSVVPVSNNKVSSDVASLPRFVASMPRTTMAMSRLSTMPRASRHCLVVDDSNMIRKVMVRLLVLLGYTTEEAHDGDQCISMVREFSKPFELVIIDKHMPNLSGPEAVTQLRAIGFRGIIIGLTGDANQVEIEKFLDTGADEVLIKPVSYEDMEKCLRKCGLIQAADAKVEGKESH
jgi:signal transduction histidine kinase/CheY-like chemotaxis protein